MGPEPRHLKIVMQLDASAPPEGASSRAAGPSELLRCRVRLPLSRSSWSTSCVRDQFQRWGFPSKEKTKPPPLPEPACCWRSGIFKIPCPRLRPRKQAVLSGKERERQVLDTFRFKILGKTDRHLPVLHPMV